MARYWTDADVQASLDGGDPEPDRVTGDLAALRASVTAFWDVYGHEFSRWWRSALRPRDRRRLLRVVAPAMPASLDEPRTAAGGGAVGSASLCPEMTLDYLSDAADALPRIYTQRRCPAGDHDAASAVEAKDVETLRLLRRVGLLSEQPSAAADRSCDLYVRVPRPGRVARLYAVTRGEEAELRGSAADRAGLLLDADLLAALHARQGAIYSTLAAIADEYRTVVVADTIAYATTVPLWAPHGVDVASLDAAAVEVLWADEAQRLADLAEVRQATLRGRRGGGGGDPTAAAALAAASVGTRSGWTQWRRPWRRRLRPGRRGMRALPAAVTSTRWLPTRTASTRCGERLAARARPRGLPFCCLPRYCWRCCSATGRRGGSGWPSTAAPMRLRCLPRARRQPIVGRCSARPCFVGYRGRRLASRARPSRPGWPPSSAATPQRRRTCRGGCSGGWTRPQQGGPCLRGRRRRRRRRRLPRRSRQRRRWRLMSRRGRAGREGIR